MSSQALCGLYVKYLEKHPDNQDMTPDWFKDLQLGIAALSGFNSEASAGGINVGPSKPPRKKKNRMHWLFVWKNVELDPSEPCIFFNKNSLVLFIKNFVRCRRLGIPVLKLEPTTYHRFSKYLWSPLVLPLSKGRVPMGPEMQRERMDFILCRQYYIEQDSLFRNNWKKWSEWTISFCR